LPNTLKGQVMLIGNALFSHGELLFGSL
jgi:hypothetical protein